MNIALAWWPVLLALPLPLLIKWLIKKSPQPSASLYNYSLPYWETEASTKLSSRWLQILYWLIWLLLLLAAARPQWLDDKTTPIVHQKRNVMLAVDLSGSMNIRDMYLDGDRVSRTKMLRHLLSDFVKTRHGDRMGLVLFADHAYLQTPLTYDSHTVSHYVHMMQQGIVGNKTAIGEAIGLATKQLMKLPAKERVLVLFTDGENNTGVVSPMEAAKVAQKNKVVIYVIGIGAQRGRSPGLLNLFTRSSRALDEPLMTQITDMTNGAYFHAGSTDDLRKIYKQLDKLQPIKGPKQYFRTKHELYYWPLAIALGLMMIGQLVRYKNGGAA